MQSSPENSDLYGRELAGPFAALCGGGTDNNGDMEACLSLAELKGGGYALRDTKDANAGELRVSFTELRNFVQGVQERPEFQG